MTVYVEDYVERGAKLLDEERPGWADMIYLEQLQMSDCSACILGQLYGDYSDAVNTILNVPGDEFGFDLPEAPRELLSPEDSVQQARNSYMHLRQLWVKQILIRRGVWDGSKEEGDTSDPALD